MSPFQPLTNLDLGKYPRESGDLQRSATFVAVFDLEWITYSRLCRMVVGRIKKTWEPLEMSLDYLIRYISA